MQKCNTASTHYHYSPLLPNEEASDCQTALVILNTPIRKPPSPLFAKLWNMSSFRVCADGGANRLFDATDGTGYIPDLIRGDLDSLRDEVSDHYATKGTKVERDPSQDSNDLDKCLQAVSKVWLGNHSMNNRICVYGAFGGRFDQEMGCIQALYVWSDVFDNRMFLYDDNTCAFLLSGEVVNEIMLPFYGEGSDVEVGNIGDGPTCGLIPIASACESVKTSGLKWNLDGTTPLEFGGIVSTSNRVMESVITIEASHSLIFTAEVMPGVKEDNA